MESSYAPIRCRHYWQQQKIPVAENQSISANWSVQEPSNQESCQEQQLPSTKTSLGNLKEPGHPSYHACNVQSSIQRQSWLQQLVGALMNMVIPSKAPAHPLNTGTDAFPSNCKASNCRTVMLDASGNRISRAEQPHS